MRLYILMREFDNAIPQVVATYQQHEFSPYLDGLDNAAKSVIDQCGSLIQDTLEHIQPKYHFDHLVSFTASMTNITHIVLF